MIVQPRRTYIRAVTGELSSNHEINVRFRTTEHARRAMRRGALRTTARLLRKCLSTNPMLSASDLVAILDVAAATLSAPPPPDSDELFGGETMVLDLEYPRTT